MSGSRTTRAIAAIGAIVSLGAVAVPRLADASSSPAPATSVAVDFNSSKGTLPAGFVRDSGRQFSDASGSGWLTPTGTPFDNTAGARVRSGIADARWAGFVHAATSSGQNLKWEQVVTNGSWDLTVGVGDGAYFDSTHVVNAEGTRLVDGFTPSAATPFHTASARVQVADGRLTLDFAGGTNTKISWVTATLVAAATTTTTAAAQTTTTTTAAPPVSSRAKAGNVAWFYKPPNDGTTVDTLASRYGTFILSPRDEPYRDQLVARGERQPFMYFRFDAIIDAGTQQPRRSQAAYNIGDFASISRNHPGWFLRDSNGNRIYDNGPDGPEYLMDPGSTGWRNFFISRVRAMYEENGWAGGVMLDNVETGLRKRIRLGAAPGNYANDIEYTGAIEGMLREIDSQWAGPANVPVTANLIEGGYSQADLDVRNAYGRWLDGMVLENFAVTWRTGTWLGAKSWNHELLRFEDSVARGDDVIVYAQGDRTDYARQRFAFASYLLVKNDRSAFRYSKTGTAYGADWWYDNYDLRIGSPLGPRYAVGTTWRRDYTGGTVVVDPAARSAAITVYP